MWFTEGMKLLVEPVTDKSQTSLTGSTKEIGFSVGAATNEIRFPGKTPAENFSRSEKFTGETTCGELNFCGSEKFTGRPPSGELLRVREPGRPPAENMYNLSGSEGIAGDAQRRTPSGRPPAENFSKTRKSFLVRTVISCQIFGPYICYPPNRIKIMINFEDHVIPNVTINLSTNLVINDPFDHDSESQTTPKPIKSQYHSSNFKLFFISQVKIRKIIPERKAQTGCILLFIRKIKKDKKNRKDSYSNWNGNDDQLKREEEILGFECWILDGHDLSTIDSKLLDNLNSLEINQICLSYHGVYCYSINVNIIVLGLVVNGIQNRESVKDISRLLSSSSCLTTRTLHEHAQHKYIGKPILLIYNWKRTSSTTTDQPTHSFSSSNPTTDKFYQQQTGPSLAVRDDNQVEIAQTVFAEVWNHQDNIHMESWVVFFLLPHILSFWFFNKAEQLKAQARQS
ncbi:hypothetical protein KEM48_009227 [Puccinia striiformis f. sp. tritici PST-130]|nr:hypothetical protein KEM48_009227 [Puccinia striiformis f. sp. tritici PST-130]